MAKKWITIGSLAKKKDGTGRFLKINLHPAEGTQITLNQGEYVNIETNEDQLKNAEAAVVAGKMQPDTFEKIKAKIEKDANFGVFARATVVREE